ncbi:hypothetical protein [Desulfomicrobium baculatum]|uniref:p-aminobenzoate N-oxygenase AurF n=1 Tax=Desulfomicrobium baculatum (strain DSM 4028 / VKM B-1378 / X) TaxID=525897 RepID=C7LRG3_DESBD|nr:hypothetical protein [Desulfomicrobium baculatum]ACU89309.1 conserved hypothetical protein [Desulfomicrobium baculatum DSM 4028]
MEPSPELNIERYAKCIEVSKRVRWDIDKDVLRGRPFDYSQKFLPDGLTRIDQFDFMSDHDKRFASQIQGRTYANMFGFVERFITAKILDCTRDHWLGSQVALESLVRFCDEELKHQMLFRKIEPMMAAGMPDGYTFMPDPDAVAEAVLRNSTWAVMGLILEIELFTQEHYKQSIAPQDNLSELYKDIFLFHWKEETSHAIVDELEWARVNAKISDRERDQAVDELIAMVADVDGILQAQSAADVDYFLKISGSAMADKARDLNAGFLDAYRWQYIFSGVEHPRYQSMLGVVTTAEQRQRLGEALATLR